MFKNFLVASGKFLGGWKNFNKVAYHVTNFLVAKETEKNFWVAGIMYYPTH